MIEESDKKRQTLHATDMIERVLKEKVAAVEESHIFHASDDMCNMHQIGNSLIDVYHAIALPKSK